MRDHIDLAVACRWCDSRRERRHGFAAGPQLPTGSGVERNRTAPVAPLMRSLTGVLASADGSPLTTAKTMSLRIEETTGDEKARDFHPSSSDTVPFASMSLKATIPVDEGASTHRAPPGSSHVASACRVSVGAAYAGDRPAGTTAPPVDSRIWTRPSPPPIASRSRLLELERDRRGRERDLGFELGAPPQCLGLEHNDGAARRGEDRSIQTKRGAGDADHTAPIGLPNSKSSWPRCQDPVPRCRSARRRIHQTWRRKEPSRSRSVRWPWHEPAQIGSALECPSRCADSRSGACRRWR